MEGHHRPAHPLTQRADAPPPLCGSAGDDDHIPAADRQPVAHLDLRALPSLCVPAARVPHSVALFTFLSLCPRLLPWARSVRACYSFTLSTRLLPRARSVRVCYSFTLSPRLLPRDRLDLLALCEGLLRPSPASHRVSS